MHLKKISLFLILLLGHFVSYSQLDTDTIMTETEAYKPTIGMGVGTIAFFGDIKDNNYGHPFTSNFGYHLYLNQAINNFLSINFTTMIGKMRVEERDIRNTINFESDIFTAGANVQYNFDNLLSPQRKISPFVFIGVEMIEFDPKSDLKLGDDEYYQHWSDGTLRNLPENSPNAEHAVIIHRDYTYETDLREAGFNDKKFSKSTFSMPVGAGVIMHLNDQFNFKLGASAHFTNTDYMDGYTPSTSSELIGNVHANPRNDRFLYSFFSISYNFQKVPPGSIEDPYDDYQRPEEYIDYAEFDNSDYDNDGVIDFLDKCSNTPPNVEVDENGCPIDSDGDGIADYKDDEINSPNPDMVNAKGVSLSDEEILASYLQFVDSTGEHAEVVHSTFSGSGKKSNNKKYKLQLGEYNEGEYPENIEKMLGIPDLSVSKKGNKTVYAAGNYANVEQAKSRQQELQSQGFEDISLLVKDSKGGYVKSNELSGTSELGTPLSTVDNSEKVVYRVQLGAFKNKPTAETYANISNLFVSESGGFYRYMSGAFDNFNDAAKHKVKMIVEGYKGAFIVAFKNGERVPLKSVGVEPISTSPLIGK